MKGGLWTPVFPKQRGYWKRVGNIATAAYIYQKMLELQRSTNLRASSISEGIIPDNRHWVLNGQDDVTTFYTYMLQRCGGTELKIRVEAQKRHHMFTRLLP